MLLLVVAFLVEAQILHEVDNFFGLGPVAGALRARNVQVPTRPQMPPFVLFAFHPGFSQLLLCSSSLTQYLQLF